ncbi:phosphate regulon sensor histidine kinase PhoR [Ferriphaselus sp. R-1]|uniref:phosphate regulon sensor histidine kinase PhoR n=1 Tax=Ferriphaselus sp. R-1 TaxID=1485544 RepID=UPI000550276F|nr:phosphate regulon sensor histidine kinase PhoR [Ferriphaselus sp. R-1]
MTDFWQRVTLPIAGLLILALLLWAVFGAVAALLLFALALLVLYVLHLRQMAAFEFWLASPKEREIPEGHGVWEDLFATLNQLIKRLRKKQDQLSQALHYMEQATSALPEGVVILDGADRIEWCNPLAEKHFGLDTRHDIGQQITYLARQPEFVQYLAMAQFAEPLLLRGVRQDDLVLSIKVIAYGGDKKLLISRDVTHLERIDTMRRDFVANVSHELRTPLTVVNGFVETLLDMEDRDCDMAKRGLQLMGEQTERMTRLVDDLLTLSRLESDNSALHEEPVDVPQLLEQVMQEGLRLSNGQHTLRLDLETQDKLLGNLAELHSAFGNLCSNAIRYTPAGGAVTLRWQTVDGQPVFSVQDSGIGIAPQHIPRLTERFYRVDRSRSRETGGTGLGLAIVKHIANRHQAKLVITSEEGQGSTFALQFPEKRNTR